MRTAIKFIFLTFFTILILIQSTLPAFAQSATPFSYIPTAPGVPQDLTTLTQGVVASVLATATCLTAGVNLVTPTRPCLGVNPQTGAISYVSTNNGGLLGLTTKFVAMTFTIPIHTKMYTDYLANNFHLFGEKTYAANKPEAYGLGYAGLQPLLNVWVGFRNVAYLFLVVVFIVIGFAIMLRLKIDPRTVMTIQNQIPKIIMGIVLITFSFAIAAFLIDMMYVVTFLILSVIGTAAHDTDLMKINPAGQTPWGLVFSMFDGGFFGIAAGVGDSVGQAVAQIIQGITWLNGILFVLSFLLAPQLILCSIPVIGGVFPFCSSGGLLTYAVASLVGALAGLVVIIAIIVALWKLWLALIKAYLMILFHATLGPLMILGGAIPGSKLGVGSWLRGLIANLAVFPAIIGVFVLGREFAKAFGWSAAPQQSQYFVPPGVGAINNSGLGGVIAFAVLMLLPSIPDAVIKALKAENGLGSAVGQGLATGFAMPAKGFKTAGQQFFRMPDPMRHTSAGLGLQMMLGRKMDGWRWQMFLKSQGLANKSAKPHLAPLIEPSKGDEPQMGNASGKHG